MSQNEGAEAVKVETPAGSISADSFDAAGGEELSFSEVARELGHALMEEDGLGERPVSKEVDELVPKPKRPTQMALEEGKPKEPPIKTTENAPLAKPADSQAGEKWVHVPTGKEFPTELEMLRYDSSYNNQRMGEENKRLRERLEKLEGQPQEPTKQLSPKEIRQMMFPSLPENQLDDPAIEVMGEGLDNLAKVLQHDYNRAIGEMSSKVDALVARLEEGSLRSKFGVDEKTESEILAKQSPELQAVVAKLSAPERLAVVKSLAAQTTQAMETRPVALTPAASDYVEGSAASRPTAETDEDADALFDRKFSALNERDQLSALGRLFQQSNPLSKDVGEIFGG